MELNLKSGWAYCNTQILEVCGVLPSTTHLNVLELGGGDSSIKILNFLSKKYNTLNYKCYETNKEWAPNHKDIEVVFYSTPSSVTFDDKIYDLILIDGPNGVSRKLWYSKLKANVKSGTIIHIDDYDHFVDFENELASNFEYDELYRTSRKNQGDKSWLTVKIK